MAPACRRLRAFWCAADAISRSAVALSLIPSGHAGRLCDPYDFETRHLTMSVTDQDKAAKARDAALQGALTQIERQFGKGSVMRMGDEGAQVRCEVIPTGA